MMASYFWVGSISYNSWMPNKLVCRIMVIGSTPPVFMGCFSQLPLYKIWGGTSFFMFLSPCGRRARNYEIRSLFMTTNGKFFCQCNYLFFTNFTFTFPIICGHCEAYSSDNFIIFIPHWCCNTSEPFYSLLVFNKITFLLHFAYLTMY